MDPVPGGPKTYGSYGSGSATVVESVKFCCMRKASRRRLKNAQASLLFFCIYKRLMLQVHHHCCVPVLHERGGGQPSGGGGSAQNSSRRLQVHWLKKKNKGNFSDISEHLEEIEAKVKATGSRSRKKKPNYHRLVIFRYTVQSIHKPTTP